MKTNKITKIVVKPIITYFEEVTTELAEKQKVQECVNATTNFMTMAGIRSIELGFEGGEKEYIKFLKIRFPEKEYN